MKNIIKFSLLILLILSCVSCTRNFEKYNTDPYQLYELPPPTLINTMIDAMMFVQQNKSQMVDQMVGSLGGYFTVTNRWGGSNFDTFNASDDWNAGPYNTAFETVYANYFAVEESTNKSGHYYAIAQLVRAAAMMRVVDCYGPIPYSKTGKGLFYVEYDSAEDVYQSIITDLTNAATILYSYSQSYPSSKPLAGNDPIYSGDYAAWARLANSLALRVAIRVNDQEAGEAACSHAAGLIETNSQNAIMGIGSQGNPYQVAAASWGDLRVNSSIVDYMVGYNDPRCESYFLKSTFDAEKYIGMRSGTASFDKNLVAPYSLPKLESSSELPVFVAAETNFLRAEAALKGWNVPGLAKDNYDVGISLSMEQYNVASGAIASYLADETLIPADHKNDPRGTILNYDRASTIKIKWSDSESYEQNLERIITQKWIANFPMGIEAWAEFRRTGFPELAPTIDNLSGGVITNNFRGMRRLRFPYTEKNLNTANYNKAVADFGGIDDESIDIFWAKKN